MLCRVVYNSKRMDDCLSLKVMHSLNDVMCAQVDYAAAGIFINITTDSEDGDSAPWWHLDGESMAPGLEPLTPVHQALSTWIT